MERIALPIWQGRISPVLDTAERLMICDLAAGSTVSTTTLDLPTTDMRSRVLFIRDLRIQTLLCGALSRPLHNFLTLAGVTVRPWLTGAAEEILAAYAMGHLDNKRFRLPGCGGRRRRRFTAGRNGQRDT